MQNREQRFENALTDWARIWVNTTVEFAVFFLTPDGKVTTWGPGGRTIFGYEDTEILGQHSSIFFLDSEREADLLEVELHGAREHGSFQTEGWRARRDGSAFWANVVTTALVADDGTFIGFAKMVRDESDKRKTHDAVIESERRFRLLVQGVTDYSIFMLSPEGHVTNWNHGARRIKGYTAEEIVGAHFSRFYTAEDAAAGLPERALETARRVGRFESEGWRVRRDGTRFWAHVIVDAIRDETGSLIGFAKITRDVTEKREADQLLDQTRAALFQSQKMEAIGKLTGGVAHDFNNVLQVLRGNLELLQTRFLRDNWSMDRLGNAIDAVERGAKLAAQLLAFGRRQALRPVTVNLAAMVRGMDELLRRALGETIEVETVVSGGLWNAFVDAHQLENVLLNLAINARDAMPEGGKLTLELSNSLLDDRYVRSLSDVPAGQYVMLGVTDTGTGMAADVIEKAFDPFFTTKPEGEGTGLGLSTAYGFVKQSGGHIRIYSEVGHGTTVRIYLPRSHEDALAPITSRNAVPTGGTETVLVVEDDLKVQATVIEMLVGLGYKVLKADNADQALAVLNSGIPVDLLFTDVVMPGSLKSPEMARRALALQPALRVLFTSGYTQNAIVHGGRLDPGVELLSKPYSREDLAFKVRHMLGEAQKVEGDTPVQDQSPSLEPGLVEVASPLKMRVLIVEDDKASREAVGELLTMLGHEAIEAENGREARDLLIKHHVDVLLTDINLPDESGTELARDVARLYAKTRIIFASGNSILPADVQGFIWRSLQKPYTFDELAAALKVDL